MHYFIHILFMAVDKGAVFLINLSCKKINRNNFILFIFCEIKITGRLKSFIHQCFRKSVYSRARTLHAVLHFIFYQIMQLLMSCFIVFFSKKNFQKNTKIKHRIAFLKLFTIKAGKCKGMYLC